MGKQKKTVDNFSYKVKSNLGFVDGKRNFFVNEQNIQLLEGAEISSEIVDLFNERGKQMLFDKM